MGPDAGATLLDLTPVRSRLQWAMLHANRIDETVKEWGPKALVVDLRTDPDSGRFVHVGRVVGEPPVDVALALSDALHQCRAALDNLVAVLRGSATRSSAYVITSTAEEFDAQAPRRLEGVPDWAVGVMRLHQPFSPHGWKYVGEALLQLHDLAIIDRHRALLLQGGVIDLDQVYVGTAEGSDTTFVGRSGGSEMVIETSDPAASPHFGVTALVREATVRNEIWPWYPSALDFALHTIGSVNRVVMAIRQASPDPVTGIDGA
jgi:hypothetical protein